MDAGTNYLLKLKSVLEHKRDELCGSLEREGIAVESTPDEIDAGMEANERELATTNIDRRTSLLHEVEAALERIDSREFGVCLECGEEIHRRRLEAVPWSPFCLQCQEAADRREAGAVRHVRSILRVA